jgi:polysaccharide deacetylase 2 family uncharacterized protein YibQ
VAILPGLPYSEEIAKAAHAQGHEVILHMPMEAKDPGAPREKGTLLTRMPRREVLQCLENSLATVPFVQGISNHQGSKATMSPALMEMVLREMKRRRLYFLDSLVTEESVCDEVARRLHIPFAQRSVFLDNEKTPQEMHGRLVQLTKAASEQGQAIGIGHDHPNTLQFLLEAIPALEQAGYELVTVSHLAGGCGERKPRLGAGYLWIKASRKPHHPTP